MITKNQIRFVKSLQQKKYRNENNCFVVEGRKSIEEAISSKFKIVGTYVSKASEVPSALTEYTTISSSEMDRISGLKTAPGILSIISIPDFNWDNTTDGLTILIDDIKDPGNLGTIIRTAVWFGAQRIICSEETVELCNPKVIQATMGAVFQIPIYRMSIIETLKMFNQRKIPSYAAILNGQNLYETQFPSDAAIIIGNESHGIAKEIVAQSSNTVTIPAFGKAESLNASIAGAVLMSAYRKSLL